ncbi:MAG: TIGR00159 family protein [Candidatus Sungbacteria bacterium]|nr:TIGR00159 family protein [Candidatus Sungbacteria bacterium]
MFNEFLATIYALRSFHVIAGTVYLADVFDVLIIAVLLYTMLLLFKQTRSFLVLVGIGIMVLLYALAQIFHLYLTSLVLQSFFAVFFVVIIVIFQEEFRRFFEALASLSTRKGGSRPLQQDSSAIDEIVQAAAYLAHRKIGALMVVRGRENFDRHIEGGKLMDAVISEELVQSIFDPSSPGHDGAVIVEGNRLSRFGVHLPLSNNFERIGKHGTRHSAALGITERSDALAIIISEEQGTISVAERGVLSSLNQVQDFTQVLQRFLKENFPEEAYSTWDRVVRKNPWEKLIAIVSASLLWIFLAFPSGAVQRDFVLPISYRDLPSGLLIEDAHPAEVTVTMGARGSRAFDAADLGTLEVSVDVNRVKPGLNSLELSGRMIQRPLSISVIKIAPSAVQIAVKKYNLASVPVRPRLMGNAAGGRMVNSVSTDVSRAAVLVPEGSATPEFISTDVVDISGIRETTSFFSQLDLPKGVRLKEQGSKKVVVTVEVKSR